jgi:2-phosphoglycolate phosphatase
MSGGIQTVLFDLDGTLLDTAPDLAAALNTVLAENCRAPLPFETIRPVVSHGGVAIIRRGFQLQASDPAIEPLRQRLLEVYRANISTHTRPFPGMDDVIDRLEARGLNWGVVTNKPGWLTQPLLSDLGLLQRAACVVSGDTLAQRKPDPAPMLHARSPAANRGNASTLVMHSAISRPGITPACIHWSPCSAISGKTTGQMNGRQMP